MRRCGLSLGLLMMMGLAPCHAQTFTQRDSSANSKNYAARFERFVKEVAACDTLTRAQKAEMGATYNRFLAEYRQVRDSLSSEDIRICSKCKVKYQREQARIFVKTTSDGVADTAEGVGKSVSNFFTKTKKKIQGAVEGFKDN